MLLQANAAAERFVRTGCAECLFVTAPCCGLSSEATLDAVGSSTRHTAGTQTRAPCPGTQLGIDAISEELYHHVKFLLTPYRLD